MQTARILVVLVIEFATRMQARQDQLDAGNFFFRVFVDRHAPPVIDNFDRAILVHRDFDFLTVARKRFVNTVVDDFMGERRTGSSPLRTSMSAAS